MHHARQAIVAAHHYLGPIGEQNLILSDAVEHVGGGWTVMGLTLSQFEHDRQTLSIDQGVDFGR